MTFVEALKELRELRQEKRRTLADSALFDPDRRADACVAWGEYAMLDTLVRDAEAYIKR